MKRALFSLALVAASAAVMANTNPTFADEVPYVFLTGTKPAVETKGKCPNGKPYAIKFTDKAISIEGKAVGMYEYKGPLGVGSLPSEDSIDVAKAFVCKQKKGQWLPFGNHGE